MIDDRTAAWTLTVVLALTGPEVAETVREPRARAAPNPPPLMDAKLPSEETQVTEPVISCVL